MKWIICGNSIHEPSMEVIDGRRAYLSKTIAQRVNRFKDRNLIATSPELREMLEELVDKSLAYFSGDDPTIIKAREILARSYGKKTE